MENLTWTDAEEKAFAEIMSVSRLTRIEAIRLYNRFSRNSSEAVRVARRDYTRLSERHLAQLARMRELRAVKRAARNGVPSRRKSAA